MGFPLALPEWDPCPFCEAIQDRSLKGIAEESDLTVTFVNNRQFAPGQVIVVPKRHAATLFDLTDDEANSVMQAARRVGTALVEEFDSDGLLLYQNNGIVSGQEVPHFHLHVVPLTAEAKSWGSGPPHIAAIEGRKFRKPEGKIQITVEKEHQVANKIREHLKRTG